MATQLDADRAERARLVERYADGPAVLEAALRELPAAAITYRPAPGEWSAHEIILHCADAESNAHGRIRYLVFEPEPVIIGYDQDHWAVAADYHSLPLEPALATIRAVRANTVTLLRRLTDADWEKVGRHTENGRYGARDWLRLYAVHLYDHADQIRRNLAGWRAAGHA